MKKLLLYICFTVFFCACSNSETKQDSAKVQKVEKKEYSNFEHPVGWFKMKVPSNWEKEIDDKNASFVLTNQRVDGEELIEIVFKQGSISFDGKGNASVKANDYNKMAQSELEEIIGSAFDFKLIENKSYSEIKEGGESKLRYSYFDRGLQKERFVHSELKTNGKDLFQFIYSNVKPFDDRSNKIIEDMMTSLSLR